MGLRGPLGDNNRIRLVKGKKPRSRPPVEGHGRPVMPSDLPDDAKRVWRRLVPSIVRFGVATKADSVSLADMCLCAGRLAECERDIAERGLLVDGDRGKVKNPACQLARQYREAFQRWADRFGLTSAARLRLEIADADDGKPVDGLAALLDDDRDFDRFLGQPNGAGVRR